MRNIKLEALTQEMKHILEVNELKARIKSLEKQKICLIQLIQTAKDKK